MNALSGIEARCAKNGAAAGSWWLAWDKKYEGVGLLGTTWSYEGGRYLNVSVICILVPGVNRCRVLFSAAKSEPRS